MIAAAAAVVLTATSVLLFAFGVNLMYLTWRATKLRPRPHPPVPRGGEPRVCVQLPIYDERYVAERVLDAACTIDWPRERLEVQVLDDSDDDTTSILARRIAHWRRKGVQVVHVRRGPRTGFKAGALAHGLEITTAPYVAIFDADFVPPPDFLRRTIKAFDDRSIGFAQARWGHIDESYSLFTRLQAMAIDFHFLVEQPVRAAEGYFTNFTGTAGVWRREAIVDSGGWSARTLTEDLDLSYRAQLRGWKASYVEDLVVPEELPVSIDAYRRQQSRWATGSFQSAFRLLGPVMRSDRRFSVKLQAAVHLLAYGVAPLMLVQLLCYPALLLAAGRYSIPWQLADASLIVILITVSPTLGFIVAQRRRGRPWWDGLPSLLCQVVGAGMAFNTMLALFRALRSGGVFVRTPKHHIERPGQEWRHQAYVRTGDPRAALEALFGVGALGVVPLAIHDNQQMLAVYASMFALGFLVVSGLSAIEALEVTPPSRMARAAAVAGVFLVAGGLLWAAALMPEPFEDGYGHWLMAANLASTGHLHDPLFGMEDTWLPAYHLLAAAVLRVFGLWQLGALKLLGAALGLVTAACVYRLAPTGRQGVVAVGLLVLNPVFLFTSGSAVVEPLVTMLLTAAGLAAVKRRMGVAAVLAAVGCATSTKAWIWVAAAVGFAVLEVLRQRTAVRTRVAWAVPAVAVLVFLQLGFAPASHSVARGTVEVMSATGRGSLPAGALGRAGELAVTYGLAALPLFVFGALGLAASARSRTSAVMRFVYVPAVAYLAAVFGLVAIGAYSGSHRYLYPALPAAALLAAAALDRYGPLMGAAAIGASALLAVAFVPVFLSFASDNAGLIAAGRAVSTSPGVLLTDSPVVAYYSGKQPSSIVGSAGLPAGRQPALEWMRARGITDLALEDISYYRATTVLPDLASGDATPPFLPLGARGRFGVSGGKEVHAYRLIPGYGLTATGEGKTAALAKGVTLGPAGTGEGVGFGVPIVQYPDGWVYSTQSTTVRVSSTEWNRIFLLDTAGGDSAHGYRFVAIPARGSIEVTYVMDGNGVAITVRPIWLAPGYLQVGVLNEQSAAFDDLAGDHQPALVGTHIPGWLPLTGTWGRLRSQALGLEWSVPAVTGAQLYGGRELLRPDFDWAGLDYMFSGGFTGTEYSVTVQEAR